MSKAGKGMTLSALAMMIFTTVFGFANGPVAFYLMGYGSIVFYVIAAILFFIPFALMMAEYGSAIKGENSGMYKWLEVSVGHALPSSERLCGLPLTWYGWFLRLQKFGFPLPPLLPEVTKPKNWECLVLTLRKWWAYWLVFGWSW